MTNLVQEYEYPVPNEQDQRRDRAFQRMRVAILALISSVLVTVGVGISDISGIWPMLGLVVLPLAVITGFGLYWYRKHSLFEYRALGVRVRFFGPEYYVPQEKMEHLVSSVHKAWEGLIEDPVDIYEGVLLEVVRERPKYPLDGEEMVGLTYNRKRISQIWGPYALSTGGAAYELLLHGAYYLWPAADEGDMIELMRRHEVFTKLQIAFDSQNDA